LPINAAADSHVGADGICCQARSIPSVEGTFEQEHTPFVVRHNLLPTLHVDDRQSPRRHFRSVGHADYGTHPRTVAGEADCVDVACKAHGSDLRAHEQLHLLCRVEVDLAIVRARTKQVPVLLAFNEWCTHPGAERDPTHATLVVPQENWSSFPLHCPWSTETLSLRDQTESASPRSRAQSHVADRTSTGASKTTLGRVVATTQLTRSQSYAHGHCEAIRRMASREDERPRCCRTPCAGSAFILIAWFAQRRCWCCRRWRDDGGSSVGREHFLLFVTWGSGRTLHCCGIEEDANRTSDDVKH
ncbi:unnamed protein product, partial [Ixodes persulcatus]